jgi:hypothetical protein
MVSYSTTGCQSDGMKLMEKCPVSIADSILS